MHALAADLQVKAGQFIWKHIFLFGRIDSICWRSSIHFLSDFFAECFFNLLKRFVIAIKFIGPRVAQSNLIIKCPIHVLVEHDGFDLLAQVVPICALLPGNKCHAVVATTHGFKHDLLQAKVEPAVRGFHIRCASNVVFVFRKSFLNTGNLLLACVGWICFLLR